MSKFDKVDLRLSEHGDLVIENGDFAVVTREQFVMQSGRNRIRNSDPDWYDPVVDTLSANLEDLRGRPNSPETAAEGAERISYCFLRDGLVDEDQLYIQPIPFDKETIAFFVFINSPYNSEPIGFEIRLNLNTGVSIKAV